MKKFRFFIATFFLPVFILISGCKKEEVPFLVEPTIEASADPMNPDYMGSTTVTWKVTGEYAFFTVELNGEKISDNPSSSLELNQITYIQRFVFTSTLEDGKKVVKFLVVTPKDEIIPPPTISIVATPDTLPIMGGLVNIICVTKNTLYILHGDDGINYTTVSVFSHFIYQDTTLTFKAVGKGGETVATIDIVLIKPEPPTEQELFLCSGPWRMNKCEHSYTLDGVWVEYLLDYSEPCMLDDIWNFYWTPERICTYEQGLLCGGNDIAPVFTRPWQIIDNVISSPTGDGLQDMMIVHLDDQVCSYIIEASEIDLLTGEITPIYIRKTFVHP